MPSTSPFAGATAGHMQTHARQRELAFPLTTTGNASHRKNWYAMKADQKTAVIQGRPDWSPNSYLNVISVHTLPASVHLYRRDQAGAVTPRVTNI